MKKLRELQQKIGVMTKDQQNPHFKNKYFDINTMIEKLNPILDELKLVVVQTPNISNSTTEQRSYLHTEIIDIENEEKVLAVSRLLIPEGLDAQKMGGALTYFRRYALTSMLFIQAEDDDGNKASGHGSVPTGQVYTQNAKEKVIPTTQEEDEELGF